MRSLTCFFSLACLLAACGGMPAVSPTPLQNTPASATATSQPPTVESPTSTCTPTFSPTPYPGPWQLVAVHNVHHNVMTAGFLSEDFGITGGVAGVMFYTTDGGQSWREGVNVSDCRYGMDIVDYNVAWTCGGMMHVRRSTDGGLTWQEVTDFGKGTTRPCHTISFLDVTTGWLATLYLLGATTDGGATWTMLAPPEEIDDIAAINLHAPGWGYLLDFSGALYATQDNGAHWTTIARLDMGDFVIPKVAYQMAAIRFSDALHGLVVASERYQSGRVMAFHTADGGQTWTSEMVPVISGPLYLARDGRLLTVITGADIMTVMRYTGK